MNLGLKIGADELRVTAATNALDHDADIAKMQEWLETDTASQQLIGRQLSCVITLNGLRRSATLHLGLDQVLMYSEGGREGHRCSIHYFPYEASRGNLGKLTGDRRWDLTRIRHRLKPKA